MTKEERAEQSRMRAAEHQRRKRMRMLLLIVGLILYVAVPLLWNGAVEFGWVQPIRTPEFQSSVRLAGVVAMFLIAFNIGDFLLGDPKVKAKREKGKEDNLANTSTPAE